jgi:hypothetical protein
MPHSEGGMRSMRTAGCGPRCCSRRRVCGRRYVGVDLSSAKLGLARAAPGRALRGSPHKAAKRRATMSNVRVPPLLKRSPARARELDSQLPAPVKRCVEAGWDGFLLMARQELGDELLRAAHVASRTSSPPSRRTRSDQPAATSPATAFLPRRTSGTTSARLPLIRK